MDIKTIKNIERFVNKLGPDEKFRLWNLLGLDKGRSKEFLPADNLFLQLCFINYLSGSHEEIAIKSKE